MMAIEYSFVVGEGWSGELRVYQQDSFEYPIVLEYEAGSDGDIRLFKTVAEVQQFIDMLNNQYRDADWVRVSHPDDQAAYEAEANGE